MKRLIALLLFLVAGTVSAADLTVTVPAAAVVDALTRCEELRVASRIRIGEYSNDLCATIFTRLGLYSFTVTGVRQDEAEIMEDAVNVAIAQFNADWPVPYVPALCGDGTLDTEFGEECDDGNLESGDGCDVDCVIE